MSAASTQVPPGTPPPSPPPSGPTHPAPTHPPSRLADDQIFLAVSLLRVDLARPATTRPPSRPPKKPINTKPIRLEAPARRDPFTAAVGVCAIATPGGPASTTDLPARQTPSQGRGPGGLGPKPSVAAEKERTPSSAVVALSGATARESTAANGAGADVRVRTCPDQGGGRPMGARGAATFALPPIPTVPSFDNGPGWAS